jgi:carboxymethylenebutenolidase
MTEIAIPSRDGERAAWLAAPGEAAPWPGVVVIHEIFGLNDDIRRLTDRIAAMGYLALAPDFYGGSRWTRCMRPALRQLEAGRGEFFDAIDSARGWLAARGDGAGRVGVVGFSLGGGFALLAAARYDFAVASVNYGEVPEDAERVLAGACPVIASYGGRDRATKGRPERLARALGATGVVHDVKTYADAGHSFLSTERYPHGIRMLARMTGMHAGPRQEAAEDAWRRIDSCFDLQLRRPQWPANHHTCRGAGALMRGRRYQASIARGRAAERRWRETGDAELIPGVAASPCGRRRCVMAPSPAAGRCGRPRARARSAPRR